MQRNLGAERKSIVTAVVTHYEKRTLPSKHYVFAIMVTWSDDERCEVYRQYSDFFSFHEMLPESVKSILSLPVRIIFGRSNISSVAEARLDGLNKYCQILMTMHTSVSQTPQVWKFFSYRNGDKIVPKVNLHYTPSLHPQGIPGGNMVMEEYEAIENYTAEDKSQLSLKIFDVVAVITKNASGWYMCHKDGKNGWVPGSYLMAKSSLRNVTKDGDVLGFPGIIPNSTSLQNGSENDQDMEVEAEAYRAIENYVAQGPGQVSFKAGDLVTVLEKIEDGWWFVCKDKTEGWAPSSYLETLSGGVDMQNSIPTQGDTSETYMATVGYTAEDEDEISFPKNAVLTITKKPLDGWWQATYEGHTGLAPSSHLVPFGGKLDDIQHEKLALKQSYKQPPRRKTILKTMKKVGRIPDREICPIAEEPPLAAQSKAQIDLPDQSRRRSSSSLPDTGRSSSPLPDKSKARRKSALPDPSWASSPLPDQLKLPDKVYIQQEKSRANHHTLLCVEQTNTSSNAHQDTQAGTLLHQFEMSQSCSSSGQIPQQIIQHQSPTECSKTLNTLLPSQGAGHTLNSTLHTIDKNPSSAIDSTPPATDDSLYLLPQTSLTLPGKDAVIDPEVNVLKLAEAIVKFVLASDNPELRAALKSIVNSDPNISGRL